MFHRDSYEPGLAESWQVASDGVSATFKLRDVKFHSKRPVTAAAVKWSMDRAVTIGGFATTQMNAGSLEKPEQFVAVDEKTFRIDFLCRDKLAIPNLCVTVPFVIDAELAKANAAGDPLAKDFLKNNVAGSDAFKVESWKPGTETIYVRNDDWAGGELPKLRRIIARDIPSPSTRRALIERGDADISYGLSPKDFKDLAMPAASASPPSQSLTPSGTWRRTSPTRRSTTSACARPSPTRKSCRAPCSAALPRYGAGRKRSTPSAGRCRRTTATSGQGQSAGGRRRLGDHR